MTSKIKKAFSLDRLFVTSSALNLVLLSSAVSAAPMLEEVVVTAQKRTQSMQDVPVAVTAVGAQELQDAGINDMTDLSMQVPSLVVSTNTSPFNTSYRIRGIGNEGNIPTFEPATGLFVDGAFKSRSGLGLGELVDVESIEILKGPQSTLYGKNVTAGVISVNTKRPGPDLEGSLELTAGTDNLRQFKGGINIPITDSLYTRWGVSGTQRDPVQKNISGEDGRELDQIAIRGQLQWDYSAVGSIRLIGSFADRDMNTTMGDIHYSQTHLNILNNIRSKLGRGDMAPNDAYDNTVNQVEPTHFLQDSSDFTLSLEHEFDNITLNLLGTYEEYQANLDYNTVSQTPYNILRFLDSQQGESNSFEIRISNNDADKFSWIAGAFYFNSDYTRGDSDEGEFELLDDADEYGTAVGAELARNLTGNPDAAVPIFDALGNLLTTLLPGIPLVGSPGDKGYFTGTQNTESLGVFLHSTYSVASNLELITGIRYSYEEKSATFDNEREMTLDTCLPPHEIDLDPLLGLPSLNTNFICLLTPLNNNYAGDDSWSDLTGTLSLSWFPVEDTLLYATVSTGFKAGGFNLEFGEFDGDSERKYDQEKVSHFEIGGKSELFDRRMRLNAALFSTSYENYQNATFVGLQFIVNNAEEVVVDGLELETTFLATENLTLTAAATYLDARYESYSAGPCHYSAEPDNGQFCSADGEAIPFAPEFSGSLIAQWTQPLFEGDFYARMSYQYTGDNLPSSDRDPRHMQDPYFLLDGRLGWRNDSFDIVLWGKNLTDETYLVQAGPGNTTATVDAYTNASEGSYQTFIGEPRTAGVTLRLFY
ncbi:TonB-dependent receptor [uncultured Zhongshania sp.]|uniref:TonB-dependent receptor n=1 Tax=uncultured Zhongshania sp. TaxID=1642288 RepID=UPI0025DB7DEC|nr:TonB-dependent receptor [uncultured Zhongshania sp.]